MEVVLIILLVIITAKYIFNKIALNALSMYLEDNEILPDSAEIDKYINRAVKKYFHI